MRSWLWLFLLAVFLAPWLTLVALGIYWLFETGHILPWLWMALALTTLAWMGFRRLKATKMSPYPKLPVFQPNQAMSPAAEAAWAKVEKMAEALESTKASLSETSVLLPLARQIIIEVAKRFQPDKDDAELVVSLPDVLLIVERVSRDMRELLIEQVPASHLITVKDGLMLWQWKQKLAKLGIIASIGQLLASPVGGALYELRMVFFKRVIRYPLAELDRWLLQNLVRKIGFYAIQLYGGELKTDDDAVEMPSQTSIKDMEFAQRDDDKSREPLRILVAGQTKAGKSSLINALFGKLCAIVDVLPSTYALSPYRLEQDGEFLGLVYDSPGYGDQVSWVTDNCSELHRIDLVLLACSATLAARSADSHFLATLRAQYEKKPDRIPPPVVVALTHIDLLRPVREWKPPYNLDNPMTTKEMQIRLCLEDVATTLAIPLEQIYAICLKPSDEWNIEAVWTAIAAQLPQARRARYLRCLKDTRAKEKWDLIFRQLISTGSLAVVGVRKTLSGK